MNISEARSVNGSGRVGFGSGHYYFIIFLDLIQLHSDQKILISALIFVILLFY
jgi:hypothetical protein